MRNATTTTKNKTKQKAKMKKFHLAWLLVLLFCMDVWCGIFDDEGTVRKARCYANCLTLVSRIPINDSSCQFSQCSECKAPCDSKFDSVANCTQKCLNSSHYCNQSCYFLGVMKNWTNIYEGNKSTIGAPGQVRNITRNVTTLTLSWQASVSTSGTVVYLLKEIMTGDKNLATPKPLPGFVFLGPRAVLTAKDACSLAPVTYRQTWNGIDFYYTVVALTEVSVLVEGPQSSAINFKKADPVASVYGPNITYNNAPDVAGDRLEFRVSFTPLLNANGTKYVGVIKRTAGKCGISDVQRVPRQESPNTFLTQFFEKTLECNVSFSVYHLTYCLPSEPKSVEYHYKGCNYLPSMNSSKCCLFDPVPTPDSAKAVRNLTYSLQTTSDFRFTAHITWLRPTQPCPDVIRYRLIIPREVTLEGRTVSFPVSATTTYTSYDLSNLEPNLVQNVTVTPRFEGDLHDLGVPKELMITTPGFPPNETIITTIQPRILKPTSPSDRFSINISWVKPKFNYSRIEGYNVTYTVHGVTKYNVTNQTWYVVRGLDYTQTLSYQVLPIFRHPWIETEAIQGVARLPDLSDGDLSIRAFAPISEKSFAKNKDSNIYSLSVEWSRPIFQRDISYYKVSYSLTGYLNDELNCPSKSSAKRKCLTNVTTSTSYVISNIRPNERIELTVTPVFENTHAFQGKAKTITARAPSGPLWSSWQIALLVLGILVFLAIIVLLLILYLRWKKKEDIKNGKVDRRKGIVIDHWEVSPNNLELIEVIGEGAFGKVYKGLLQELPEQASRTGSSSMTFGRRSIRSTRSSHPEEGLLVAVKLLHDSADDEQTREFLKEIQLMKDVGSHRNIVNMLGCGTICEPMFLIVEYLPNGDLLHYLRNRRGKATKYPESDSRGPNHSTYCQAYYNMNKPRAEATLEPVNKGFYVNTKINAGFQDDKEGGGIQLVSVKISGNEAIPESKLVSSDDDKDDDDETITSGDMMAFAWQVAQGMEYLSKRGYVHRDLAARNILVGNNKEAKVADFGLTRHMYENLYRAKTTRRLPLKWMSIEAIFDQTFTSQSDVWSFGILLWEIVTLGGTPYPAKTNKELLNFLKEGQRMEKPDTCDDEVYRIMLSCWKEKADDRPTFIQIREKFEEMMMRENPYFDPSSVDESRDYYNVPSFNSIQDSDDGDDEVFNEILGFENKNEMESQSTGEKSEKSSESEKYEVESKEKEPNIGDIESLLYRKQHHSLKLK